MSNDSGVEYGSGNGTTLSTYHATTEDYIISSIYSIICVFGLAGNLLAMIIAIYNPKLKTASTAFIFNLALADFLFLLSIPFAVTNVITRNWMFGEFMCKAYMGGFGINLFASVYTLVAMSLDRYIAICCIRANTIRNIPNSILCCVCIWIAATLLTLPLLLYARVQQLPNRLASCNIVWEGPAIAYTLYTSILGFILPFITITVFYVLIVMRLRSQSPALNGTNLEHMHARNRRVTIIVFCIIMAFLVCWLPYWCYQAIFLSGLTLTKNIIIGYHISTVLYICNSALNPILYGFLSQSYRKSMAKLFRCEKSWREGTSSRPTSVLHTIRTPRTSMSYRKRVSTSNIEANKVQSIEALTQEQTNLLQLQEKTNLLLSSSNE